MLDAKLLRQNPEIIRQSLEKRNEPPETLSLFERFFSVDKERRELILQTESLKAKRNAVSQEVAIRKQNKQDADDLIEDMRTVGDQIKAFDDRLKLLDDEQTYILMRLPNIPHESVPYGKSEEDNPEIRKHGVLPTFSFSPKPHWELGVNLGILDFERAAKVTGSRFVFASGLGARLERALINFMIDVQTGERGYVEVWPPYLGNTIQCPILNDNRYDENDDGNQP